MGGVVGGGWMVTPILHDDGGYGGDHDLGFESDFQAKNPSNTPTSGP